MARQFKELGPDLQAFIAAQKIFFVGTAASTGQVNVSPKGMDSLRVRAPNRIVWLNLTGSGNETAGHLAQVNRMTLMWCSFDTRPLILRAYGRATAIHRGAPGWDDLAAEFPVDLRADPGARQIFDLTIDLVQTSCGYAVPFMQFEGERPVLRDWAAGKGSDGIAAYWDDRNRRTIDGFDTGIDSGIAAAAQGAGA